MDTISIKVKNKKQSEKIEKIFARVCSREAPMPMSYNPELHRDYFCVNTELDADWYWFEGCYENYDTWREFILAYLNNRYVMTNTPEEKLFLIDFFKMEGLTGISKKERAEEKAFSTFYFDNSNGFYESECETKNKHKKISFDKVKRLLNSVKEFEQQEFITEEKSVKLTQKEASLLVACLTNQDRLNDLLSQNNCGFMIGFANDERENLFRKIDKIADPLDKNYHISDCKHLFVPQIEEFYFSCGLETKTKDRQIAIGCQTKSTQEWLTYINNLLSLNLDKVTVDIYSFEKSEIIAFRDWLKKNFNL